MKSLLKSVVSFFKKKNLFFDKNSNYCFLHEKGAPVGQFENFEGAPVPKVVLVSGSLPVTTPVSANRNTAFSSLDLGINLTHAMYRSS